MSAATITIGLDPLIDAGPLQLSWHGLTIAIGLFVGALMASRFARRHGLDTERIWTLTAAMALAGMAGARLLYLAEQQPADLVSPAAWFGTRGFAFYGGLIGGGLAAALLLRRWGLPGRYLDALAYGFPAGMAVGRIGDVINGEHFGPPTDVPWGIRYTHPDAEVPSATVAYHSGGLYEVVLALAILAFVVVLARRARAPGVMLWSVVGLYAAGRFVMFFYREDSETLAAGLNGTQWISLALASIAVAGLWLALRSRSRSPTGRHAPVGSRP